MENLSRIFRKARGKINTGINEVQNFLNPDDPLLILPYRGYANENRLYLRGRLLENENIFDGKSDSEIRNLLDSIKRFETDEIANAELEIKIAGQTFEVTTDREGYFTLDSLWNAPQKERENAWLEAEITLRPEYEKMENVQTRVLGEVYLPARSADYMIITDVDDTVLQTHVTSLFKLKMLYATFLKDSHERLPMEGVRELFQAFVKGGDGKKENPIFYVSNSPWNLYDLLEEFMDVQNLPKGPILLRDYGIRPSEDFGGHKMNQISRIIETYPDLPAVLLGDTAAEDADFYIELARKYPGRVAAIYIRQTRDTKNARRIARLIEANSDIEVVLMHETAEITQHAIEKGYLPVGIS